MSMARVPPARFRSPDEGLLRRILEALERLLSEIPKTEEAESRTPDERAKEIARNAAMKAAMLSGGLALPPGPFGYLTILPDLYGIWKIQVHMVADIAGAYGKTGYLSKEQMLYCLFRHAAAQAVRDIVVRVGERILIHRPALRVAQQLLQRTGVRITQRLAGNAIARWLPIIGALGVGAYAYYDTGQVADTAIDLFRRDIEFDPQPAQIDEGRPPAYDRELLLGGAKRNTVLDLWEVQRYGSDSYGDQDYVAIYGMRPADWYARGLRVLGRTAVECTRDRLGDAIGKDVAALATRAPLTPGTLVIDPFTGSGNTLYWLLRHLPGARGIGFESDAQVFQLTRQNMAVLALQIDIRNADSLSGLAGVSVVDDELVIAFIAPPWGDALDKTSGLDLRRTMPPITAIVDVLFQRFPQNYLLCAIQVYETVLPASMAEVRARFDWSMQRTYELNAPGQNHGLVLGTKRWVP